MLRNVIKYGGLALVIIGIILVMKNLFASDSDWNNDKKNQTTTVVSNYYNATVSLLDKETKKYIVGANLVIKDKDGNVISGWTTDEGVHLVPNLKKGTYVLVEEEVSEGYRLNSDGVTFEIKNKDQEVIMYNTKMTEEEKAQYEAEQRAKNTTASEVGVDNTLSQKDITVVVIAIISIVFGIDLLFFQKKCNG